MSPLVRPVPFGFPQGPRRLSMDRRDEPRYPRSTKDGLLKEGRGVEAPNDDAPYRRDDHDEHGGEAIGAGAGALGGAAVGMAVGGPPGAVAGGAIGAVGGAVAGEAAEGDDEA